MLVEVYKTETKLCGPELRMAVENIEKRGAFKPYCSAYGNFISRVK